jgi:hypothetical protein
MDAVRLRFTAPGATSEDEVALDYAVIHVPKPRHARLEGSDSPIFDQLLEEFRAGS